MDKTYHPHTEDQIYQLWEQSGAFTPVIDPAKTPFTIILPPPNANEPLHAGHALYTVEDIMVRYHRMLGDPTLWLPGTDHAGIETQFVFEKKLKAEGKSRFDYDRDTLYNLIATYVNQNRTIAVNQMKRLGFSLDWTRERFTLDEAHNRRVFAVFKKMHADGLIYRDEKIVNYCTRCGTAFSHLEVNYVDEIGCLYYLKYGPFVLATTRPETKFGDTAVAVNPKDKRYSQYVGQEITVDGLNGPFTVKVIADDMVDMNFGTGVVKITPAHDPDDFEAGQRHRLEVKKIIGFDGRLNQLTGKYAGLTVNQARQQVVADMQDRGMIVKVDDHYSHRLGRCYRCNSVIEPMVSPQWFVRIAPLAQLAVGAVKADKVKIFPPRFKKQFLTWMKDVRDWPISRQIVWGHRLPVWYNLDANPDIRVTFKNSSGAIESGRVGDLLSRFSEIKSGLQTLLAPTNASYFIDPVEANDSGPHILQETDTFDTWFSSGQWPYSTLGWEPDGNHSPDFKYFYPTTVLDTMWDILFFWVARMIMMGVYVTGDIPFRVAHMHSRVLDGRGQKMSKSKGNAINPLDITQQYGADALRWALVVGVAPGSDIALSPDKIRAARNFVNKIWNATRFILMLAEKHNYYGRKIDLTKINAADQDIIKNKVLLSRQVTKLIDQYKFGLAAEKLYDFFWHQFCDVYIESVKDRGPEVIPVLIDILITNLKLFHPFIPFITETVYQELVGRFTLDEALLIAASWPHDIS